MGGEDAGRPHLAHRGGGGQSVLLDPLPRPLEQGESRVPFVQVQHRGADVELAQGAKAADPEQDLLLDAGLLVAAVEPPGEVAVGGGVGVVAGVEQQERAAPHLDVPDAQVDLAAGERDREAQLLAVRSQPGIDRQLFDGDRLVEVLLPAGGVDLLVHVPLVVEQADADHRHPQVAHALEVITRQHPEAAGIDRDRVVQAELGGEVGQRPGEQRAGVGDRPVGDAAQVLAQAAVGLVDAGLHLEIVHAARDLVAVHALEQRHRVVVDRAPDVRRQLAEDGADVRLPGPPQVARQLAQLAHDVVGARVGHVLSHRQRQTSLSAGGAARAGGSRDGDGSDHGAGR